MKLGNSKTKEILLQDWKYFQSHSTPCLYRTEEQAIKSYILAKLEQILRSKIPH